MTMSAIPYSEPAVAQLRARNCPPVARADAVDYVLHDMLRIRLLGASARDVELVQRQVGPLRAPVAGAADITVRFVEHFEQGEELRYVGANGAAYTDDAFYVLRNRYKTTAQVQIPMERLGDPCELVCERGLPRIPLLMPIINLTVLQKGWIPLHAAAFRYHDRGFLVMGWAQGGKTETLLGFLERGAEYIGDEWVYLRPDGNLMRGIPEPVFVWDWHVRQLPWLWARLAPKQRRKLKFLRWLDAGCRRCTGDGTKRRATLSHRLSELIRRQACAYLPLSVVRGGPGKLESAVDVVLFTASHRAQKTTVARADPLEVAQRMTASLDDEWGLLRSYYRMFRFAFPKKRNLLLERASQIQGDMLETALQHKQTYGVYHPYPVSLAQLADEVCRGLELD